VGLGSAAAWRHSRGLLAAYQYFKGGQTGKGEEAFERRSNGGTREKKDRKWPGINSSVESEKSFWLSRQ